MKLEYYSAEKLKKEIIEIIEKHINLDEYDVFFFGSRVIGKSTDRSDIDIGIKGDKPVPAGAFLKIQEDVENIPTLYKIEIVDFYRMSPIFKNVALNKIEILNKKYDKTSSVDSRI